MNFFFFFQKKKNEKKTNTAQGKGMLSFEVRNTDGPEEQERCLREVVRALVPEMRTVADSALRVSKFVGGITNSRRELPQRTSPVSQLTSRGADGSVLRPGRPDAGSGARLRLRHGPLPRPRP